MVYIRVAQGSGLYSCIHVAITTREVSAVTPSFFIIILLLNIIYEAIFIYLFIIYIKDVLKFLFIYNIAVIIPFSYSACNITIFFLINICLAGDLFRKPEADF